MKEETQKTIDKWKAKAEELRVQLHLGSKEASEKFEEAKDDIEKWAKHTGEALSDSSSEKARELKIKLEELRVQAALAKADSKDALSHQQKNLSAAMHEASIEAKEIAKDTESEARKLAQQADEKLDQWQTRVDLMRIQAHLGTKEAAAQWEIKKKEVRSKLAEIESKLEQAKKEGGDNWDHFSKEISESWTHFKEAFKKKN